MQYQVVGLAGSFAFETREELIAAVEESGRRHTGDSDSPRLREELRGQPCFTDMVGPMYGGEGVVRYETARAYQELSS